MAKADIGRRMKFRREHAARSRAPWKWWRRRSCAVRTVAGTRGAAVREIAWLCGGEPGDAGACRDRAAAPAAGPHSARAVILVTSNRGLCGAFNVNLIRKATCELLAELKASEVETEFHVVGKKGISVLPVPKRGNGDDAQRTSATAHRPDDARSLINPLAERVRQDEGSRRGLHRPRGVP